MIDASIVLTFATALGCGLMGGAFFSFSSFVMQALARLPPAQGIAAMQSINILAPTPVFMTGLFGTAAACLVVALLAISRWQRPGAGYMLAGALIYIVGNIVVTMFFNVPRNNALAVVDPASAEGARVWADYLSSWTMWNHVRTVTGMAAAAALMMALWVAARAID